MSRVLRSPSLLGLARLLAWGAGYCAAFVVAYDYAQLPDELPLSRWSMAHKTMFLALRVPLAHLAFIGVCELAARCLSRAPAEQRPAADRVGATLLCTAGVKAWLSAKELIRLPEANPATTLAAFLVMVTGCLLGAWFVRPLLGAGVWSHLRATRLEQALAVLLIALIAVLNLAPLVPGWPR